MQKWEMIGDQGASISFPKTMILPEKHVVIGKFSNDEIVVGITLANENGELVNTTASIPFNIIEKIMKKP